MSKSNASKAEVLQYMQNEQKNDNKTPSLFPKARGSFSILFKLLCVVFFEVLLSLIACSSLTSCSIIARIFNGKPKSVYKIITLAFSEIF